MKPVRIKRERGAALLALLAVIMLGASWFLFSQLNTESGGVAAVNRARNTAVLNRAKQALIGYVAMQSANSGEDNPGALPCPEAAGYFDNPGQEGQAASGCTLPKVGRFPWRTIGTEKLVDSAGEPLWYVVSPGWAPTSAGANTNINSNSIGQLTVDGTATTPVASPGIVNFPAHGLAAGDAVSFTTGGTLPTGITAGITYFVIAAGLTADAFEIATAPAGTAINFTGASAGTHNMHRNPFGAANSIVALIIAPGPAFSVPAATGCAAWNQVRPVPGTTPGPDWWRNYLECENATYPPDATFVMTGPAASFNDQVVRVTVADIMPGIEAAVAKRIERDIVPALKTVYTPATWGFTGSNPVLPFAAPFANPGPGTGTSDFQGEYDTTDPAKCPAVASRCRGLLPFNQTQGCTADPANPRCLPSLITWTPADAYISGAYGYFMPSTLSCSWESTYVRLCQGQYHEDDTQPSQPIRIEMQMTFNNVTMGLRKLDTTWLANAATNMEVQARNDVVTDPWLPQTMSYSVTMNDGTVVGKPAGSVTITFGATLPNIDTMVWGTFAEFRIRLSSVNTVVVDHALLDSTNANTGWFVRNEWYRLAYYAVAQGHTASTLPPACTTGTNCLSIANVTPTGAQRAIIILGGRSVNSTSRPSATLADYLESGNATGAFTRNTISASPTTPAAQRFNDRVVVVGSN